MSRVILLMSLLGLVAVRLLVKKDSQTAVLINLVLGALGLMVSIVILASGGAR